MLEKVINLLRPGAIGDVLISSTIIRGLRKKYPGYVINYYTWFSEAGELIDGIDNLYNSEDWDKRIKGLDFILNPYPYPNPMTKHLIEYYADCVKISPDYEYSLKPINIKFNGEFITLHVKTGWSIYKEWSFEKWAELIKEIRPLIGTTKIVQIGGKDDPLIEGVDRDFRGKPLAESCALIRDAKLHLGIDSFSNHIAGAYKKPAVILFGSTTPLGFGYNTAKNIFKNLKYCKSAYDAAKNAHALIILTEWQEFKEIDLPKIKSLLKQPIIIDGRNIFNKERMKKLGFISFSIGRRKI